jgi:hypothetical protein
MSGAGVAPKYFFKLNLENDLEQQSEPLIFA